MRSVGGYAVTLERGQHEDPASVDVGYRAIHNVLAFLGIQTAHPPHPVGEYEALSLREVVDRRHEDDKFSRAWSSFDILKKGDVVATRHDGTVISAPRDGWIVFPDAKAKPGNEWFYFAEPLVEI